MNIKRLVIAKKFESGGPPLDFGSVRFCPFRGGWIFNCSLPGRRGSRRAWPTPWAAIPRWVRSQGMIHIKLIAE